MTTTLFTMPIKKGKIEDFKNFLNECFTTKKAGYADLLLRYDLNTIDIWINKLGDKDYAVFTHDMGVSVEELYSKWEMATHPFDLWFASRLDDCYDDDEMAKMNTFPVAVGSFDARKIENKKPQLSSMMTKLYGEDAQKVYNRLEELDPFFNQFVQEEVYDEIFNMPPLDLREKSLITVASLFTLNRAEQSRIHLIGFLNLGFSPNAVVEMIQYMAHQKYIATTENAMTALKTVSKEKNLECDFTNISFDHLSTRDKALIDSAVHIALGDNQKTKNCFKSVLNEKTLNDEEIKGALRHLMIYCGCPCAMNGFAVMLEI